jgi:hypothetical protein
VPNNNPTSAPISAPPSAPPGSKSSNCGLPSPQQTFTTMKDATDALQARTRAGNTASLSLKVRLGKDETLQWMVNVPTGVSVHIDGAGSTITLLDFGFHVDGGRLCLHDVELTGGRNVPALVVLGEAAVANASHVRISNCATYTDTTENFANLISALDLCTAADFAIKKIPDVLLPTVCKLLPVSLQQCCDVSKKPATQADLRLVSNMGAGTAHGAVFGAPLALARIGAIGSLASGRRGCVACVQL